MIGYSHERFPDIDVRSTGVKFETGAFISAITIKYNQNIFVKHVLGHL